MNNLLSKTKEVLDYLRQGTPDTLIGDTKNAPTSNQINYYKLLCSQKGVQEKTVEELTYTTIRIEIESLKVLPNYRKASDRQVEALKSLGLPSENISFDEASKMLDKANMAIPATKNQLDMILNYYRFGIIKVLPKDLNKSLASKLIGNEKYSASYIQLSAGKATLPQVKKLIELYEKVDKNDFDIMELSNWSIDHASSMISQLSDELKHRPYRENTDKIDALDDSRSRDKEDLRREVGGLQLQERKDLYNKMYVECLGISPNVEYTLDNFMQAIEMIADMFGESFINEWLQEHV